MAEEISDDRFKGEMMRMMQTAIIKIDGMDVRLANVETNISTLKTDVKFLKKEVRINSGKLDDVMFRVIEMYNRLFDIEKQLKSFDERLADLEKECEKIFAELLKLAENIENNLKAKAKIDELDLRVKKLEKKVFA